MELKDFFKISKNLTEGSGNQLYVFGSFLKEKFYEDVDLLIVYNNYHNMDNLKNKLLNEVKFLVHFTCLSVDEEKELDFITKSKAVKFEDL